MKDALEHTPRRGRGLCRTAIWSGLVGIVLVLLSGLGPRLGLLGPFQSMLAYTLGSLALIVALVCGAIGLLRSRGEAGGASRPGTWLALVAGLVVTAVNVNVIRGAGGAAPIHDISTDLDDPPAFVAVVPLRAADGAQNPPAYAGAETAAAQRQTYPDIQPLLTNEPADKVFSAARDAVAQMGWTLVEASVGDGRIEATATTPWVGFRDDVVIRVASIDGQTRVDVRSKSRVGRGDMGANAKRVRAYLAALEAALAG